MSYPIVPRLNPCSIDQFTDLNDYKVICIVGPKESFSKEELVRLGQYLEQGGRLYIALNHAVGQISYSQNNGFINRVGIEDMLEEFGLKSTMISSWITIADAYSLLRIKDFYNSKVTAISRIYLSSRTSVLT